MNRIFTALLLVALSFAASAEVWQTEYGVARTFNFKLYNADGTLDTDEADGGTEVSLSCNEGAETTATNDFVDEGTFYSIALTAGELQCERIAVVIAATTTEVFFIQTFGSTSGHNETLGWLTGDAFARLGAPVGASISADLQVIDQNVDDIEVDTGTTLDDLVDDLESRLGTPSNLGGGATVAANLSDIEGQTDDIGVAGAGLTAADDAVMTRLGTPAGASVSADIAAVKADTAAILDDTGTTGVLIAENSSNCREVQGCDTQGTLSGTHSTTTADLGTNAPTNDIAGMTLVIPTHNFSRVISSYNTGTGVATWDDATAVTLANGNQYYLWATAPSSGGSGGLDAAGVRSAIGLASANLDTQLGAIDDYVDTEVAAILDDTGTSGVQIPAGEIVAATFGAGAIDASAIAADAIGAAELAADAVTEIQSGLATSASIAALNDITAAEAATAVTTAQGIITGTCDSGSTTTCVDNALTQADATQLEDRLICFDDSWCALITTFTPGTDTATTTKVAPSTRASKAYTIFPSTLE